MNWKDYPHLFANGKFKIKTDMIGFYPYVNKICGYKPKYADGHSDYYLTHNTARHLENCPVSSCTLIARPISDMTDEEVRVYNSNWEGNENYGRNIFVELINTETAPSRLFLYLLSIGVYPFDDDTDVIYK